MYKCLITTSALVNNRNLKIQLDKYAESITSRLKRQLRIDRTVATRELIDSVLAERSGRSIDLYMASHYRFVDEGRSSGTMPNIMNIREWAEARGIGTRGTRRQFYDVTWKISQAIRDRGTIKRFGGNKSGSGFIDQVIEQLRPAMTEDFREAVRLDIEESIRKPQDY